MKIKQYLIKQNETFQGEIDKSAQLVLCFGAKSMIADPSITNKIISCYPNANTVFCSTAGEIFGDNVFDNTLTITAVSFESTVVKAACNNVIQFKDSFEAGKNLAHKIDQDGLKYILLISDGSQVNGSEMLKGINTVIDPTIPITGGMAGDAYSFESTLASVNMMPETGKIIAISFYGENLMLSHSSMGGWEPFGLERVVTKSNSNILYEIDGKNALQLYKTYLGKYADDLPGSALLFPLSVKINDKGDTIVRTILAVNHQEQSMSFAGDIPMGSKVRFMKANFDKLIDAASIAAQDSLSSIQDIQPELAILISCVGRKIILSERIDEEVEAVRQILGNSTTFTGFYSYGEISPLKQGTTCELHNQTMTITCLQELT